MKLRDLAERLACRLEGDGDIDIMRVAGIHDAGPGDITFLANPKYERLLPTTRASAVILRDGTPAGDHATLRTAEPYLAFARAVGLFAPAWRPEPGVHQFAAVAASARLGAGTSIGPFVAVGERSSIGERTIVFPNVTIGSDVRVGADCVIHSNASLRDGITVGDRVILQNGVVLGSDGYGFVRRGDGTHEKIPQFAPVVVEDDVEIGANTAIDRPAVGETRIGRGSKLDNLVQIAHGVSVGRNVLMAAQVGVAGSSEIGDDVVFAGQVGVAGHLTIGRGVVALAQTGIPASVEPGAMIAGYPAIDSRDWRRAAAVYRRLPELKRRLEELERQVAELTAARGGRSSEHNQ